MKSNETLSKSSRRTFLQLSAAATAAMAFRIATEASLAAEERNVFHPGAIVIDANENPLGPCDAARKAIVDMAPQGGRYSYWLKEEFVKTFTEMEGIKPEYLRVFPGSSEPLHFSVLSFTSPAKSYVTADPGYEAGMKAAKISGARIVKTPLTKTYSHDIKAMLAAAPDAGLFYVCTPNNPTGTMTPHSDIEQLVAAKPKGSVVLADEAYIHFSDGVSASTWSKPIRTSSCCEHSRKFTAWPAFAAAWPLAAPTCSRSSKTLAAGAPCPSPPWPPPLQA